jgi:hypothetical protein
MFPPQRYDWLKAEVVSQNDVLCAILDSPDFVKGKQNKDRARYSSNGLQAG